MRAKIPVLTEALTGRFTEHHAFLTRMHLDLIDRHTRGDCRDHRPGRGGDRTFRGFLELICSISGISVGVADIITAETGADMNRFPPPRT